jgi:hypothetical protein
MSTREIGIVVVIATIGFVAWLWLPAPDMKCISYLEGKCIKATPNKP